MAKQNKKRKFIGYEWNDEQVFRIELGEFTRKEITQILRKIVYLSKVDLMKSPEYKKFTNISTDFGRIRIGDFRIFVHKISSKEWLMLRIFRKKTNDTPENEIEIALQRLINFYNNE